jgi:molecular chaperone IbpA
MVQTYTWDLFKDPFFIGFNRELDRLTRVHSHASTSTYPPYNVIKTDDEDTFLIEVAVAGFAKEDLGITIKDQTLTVKGEIKDISDETKFVHKGIAARKFTREFALGEYIEVTGAEVLNGMLTIKLERVVPEEEKPKTIKIK